MRRYWIRTSAGRRENLGAALAGAAVGAVVFYFTRMLLAREPIGGEEWEGASQGKDRPTDVEGEAR